MLMKAQRKCESYGSPTKYPSTPWVHVVLQYMAKDYESLEQPLGRIPEVVKRTKVAQCMFHYISR